jgi:hypothetical protein
MSDYEQTREGSNSIEQGSSTRELDVKVEDLLNRFEYHPPKGNDQIMIYAQIREAGRKFALLLVQKTPSSTEREIALQKIEEAVMWGNAGVARNT